MYDENKFGQVSVKLQFFLNEIMILLLLYIVHQLS